MIKANAVMWIDTTFYFNGEPCPQEGLIPRGNPKGRADKVFRTLNSREHRGRPADCDRTATKKADVVEHPEVCDHVGLLFDEPPGTAGLPFI